MSQDSKPICFECQLCGACCRDEGLLITLTRSDIIRIAFGLGIGAKEILRAVDFHLLGPDNEQPIGLRDFPLIKTEQGPAYLAIKKLENGDCVFLKDNKCMIHPIRPGVCQSFPFVFRKENDALFWGLSAKKEICPGIGMGKPVPAIEIEGLAEGILGEQSAFREFVAQWNRAKDEPTAAEFLLEILKDVDISF